MKKIFTLKIEAKDLPKLEILYIKKILNAACLEVMNSYEVLTADWEEENDEELETHEAPDWPKFDELVVDDGFYNADEEELGE